MAGAQTGLLKEKYRIELSDHTDRVLIAKFNYDGSKVLLVGNETTEVWSIETGRPVCTFSNPISLLKDGDEIVWQPGGDRLLQYRPYSYSKKAVAIIWDSESGRRLATLTEKGGVSRAQWNSDGNRILSVGFPSSLSDDATYSVRDENGRSLRTEKFGSFDIHSVTFSNSGNKLIVSYHAREGQKPVRIYDADSGRLEASFEHGLVNVNPLTHAIFAGESPDGKYLCGQIDTSKGVVCWKSNDQSMPVYSFLDTKETGDNIFLGFSPDSKKLAILRSRQKEIDIADAATGHVQLSISGLKTVYQPSIAAANNSWLLGFEYRDLWSPDGNEFIATDFENVVSIWNLKTNKQISRRPAIWNSDYDWFVGTLPTDFEVFRFNKRNGLLLSVSNQVIRICDPSNGALLKEFSFPFNKKGENVQERYVSNWSPDGEMLLTAENDNRTVIVWTVTR